MTDSDEPAVLTRPMVAALSERSATALDAFNTPLSGPSFQIRCEATRGCGQVLCEILPTGSGWVYVAAIHIQDLDRRSRPPWDQQVRASWLGPEVIESSTDRQLSRFLTRADVIEDDEPHTSFLSRRDDGWRLVDLVDQPLGPVLEAHGLPGLWARCRRHPGTPLRISRSSLKASLSRDGLLLVATENRGLMRLKAGRHRP